MNTKYFIVSQLQNKLNVARYYDIFYDGGFW